MGAWQELVPWKASRSLTVGPRPTKSRPWAPRVSHATSESGPPDRSGVVGCSVPGVVSPFASDAAWLTASTMPLNKKPWKNPITTTTASTTPTAIETRRGTETVHLPDEKARQGTDEPRND